MLLVKITGKLNSIFNSRSQRQKGNAGKITNFPLPFEDWAYRVINPEVASLTDDELLKHYDSIGKAAGLRCHQVVDRLAFVNLIPTSIKTLEIGSRSGNGPRTSSNDQLGSQAFRSFLC